MAIHFLYKNCYEDEDLTYFGEKCLECGFDCYLGKEILSHEYMICDTCGRETLWFYYLDKDGIVYVKCIECCNKKRIGKL